MQIDLGNAADLVMATEGTLQDFHTDNEWEKVFTCAMNLTALKSVPLYSHEGRGNCLAALKME